MYKSTGIGFALIVIGLLAPRIIYAIAGHYHWGLNRELSVLPWLLLTLIGTVLLLRSMLRRWKQRIQQSDKDDNAPDSM